MAANLAMEAQGIANWSAALKSNPDVMISIIRDLAKILQSGDRTGVTGRRPSPKAVSFEKLWSMLFPTRFTNEPFTVALKELVDDKSQREFAALATMSQPHFSRLLSGKTPPTMDVLESCAQAAGVAPSYFLEWRAMKLGQLVTDVLMVDPDMSTVIVKKLAAL